MTLPASLTEVEKSRALPQLSFRLMLLVVTGAAVAAWIMRQAWLGSPLATSIVYAFAAITCVFLLFAILFFIAWIPAVIGRDVMQDVHRGNPFSADQLPPQVLPPREPGS